MLNFIYNPIAGKGRSKRIRAELETLLKAEKIAYRFWETDGVGGARRLAEMLTEQGESEIVAMGGDGTIHEILNGLKDPACVRMGIIPCGSGNDFAASLGLPKTAKEALAIITHGEAKPTDYMECSGVRGMNEIGAGIDVEILKRCYRAKFLKGSLNYFVSLLITVLKFSLTPLMLHKDGKHIRKNVMIVGACNGRQIGGGIKICPPADATDGQMDIVLVENIRKSGLPGALVKLVGGKLLEHGSTEHYLAESLDVDFEAPVTVQIDGELYENLPLKVRLVCGGIHVYRN